MSSKEDKKIKITKNGPYEISGSIPLNQATIVTDQNRVSESWETGKKYQGQEELYYLCRCGHSEKKPFCDGHHEEAGFIGREKAHRPPYVENAGLQKGPGADLLDDDSLCVGARFCDRGDTVWGLVEESDDPEKLKMAIEEACNCPAGRLTVVDSEGRLLEPQLPQEVSLVQDPANSCRGPIWVKGGIAIYGHNGDKYEVRNRVTLCRCGHSSNQPYCDASHYECPTMKGLDK